MAIFALSRLDSKAKCASTGPALRAPPPRRLPAALQDTGSYCTVGACRLKTRSSPTPTARGVRPPAFALKSKAHRLRSASRETTAAVAWTSSPSYRAHRVVLCQESDTPRRASREGRARVCSGIQRGRVFQGHVAEPVALGRRVLKRGSRAGASSARLVFPVAAIRPSPASKEGRVCSRSSFRLPLAGASRPTPLAAPFQPRAEPTTVSPALTPSPTVNTYIL